MGARITVRVVGRRRNGLLLIRGNGGIVPDCQSATAVSGWVIGHWEVLGSVVQMGFPPPPPPPSPSLPLPSLIHLDRSRGRWSRFSGVCVCVWERERQRERQRERERGKLKQREPGENGCHRERGGRERARRQSTQMRLFSWFEVAVILFILLLLCVSVGWVGGGWGVERWWWFGGGGGIPSSFLFFSSYS